MVHPSIPLSSITRYVLLQTVHRLTHLTPFKAVSILLKHDLNCYGFYRFIIVLYCFVWVYHCFFGGGEGSGVEGVEAVEAKK